LGGRDYGEWVGWRERRGRKKEVVEGRRRSRAGVRVFILGWRGWGGRVKGKVTRNGAGEEEE